MNEYIDTHNVYLQVWCEMGTIGLLLFLFIIYKTLFLTIHMLKQSRLNINNLGSANEYYLLVSLGIQMFFCMYCMTGNPLYDIEVFFPYIISYCISCNINLYYTKK